MNPKYSSPRNIGNITSPAPFLSPNSATTKPFAYPRSPVSHFNANPSKSFQGKPQQFSDITKTSNDSSFGHYSSHSSSNFPKGEMTKSNLHDNLITKDSSHAEGKISTPPQKKQPRFSQSALDGNTGFDFAIENKKNFMPMRFQSKKQQPEGTFMKKQQIVPEQPKEESKRQWLKQSMKRKAVVNIDNFVFIKSLGKGKYGQVHLAKDKKSDFICAIKMMEKALLIDEGIVDQFIREVKIQIYFNHPNIVKMYGCFSDEKYIYILLEAAMDGPFFQQIKRSQPMPETKAASLMRQVCIAVQELHSHRVIHRDIKPQNIVMHEGIAKLCDFGWSVYRDDKMRTTFCGTPLYVSPQILKGNQYDEKIDIWSLGIMTYQLLVGESPFKIKKQEQLIKIVKEEISIPSYVYVSRQARQFLDSCLKKNPQQRAHIKSLVNHLFFIKNAQKQKQEKKQQNL